MALLPNIVMIVGDHHRADIMGHNGCSLAYTPNLDMLCRQGVNFNRAVTISPESATAYCVLLEGVYPHKLGSDDTTSFVQSTLGGLLAKKGYQLVEIGHQENTSLQAVLDQACDTVDRLTTTPSAVVLRFPGIGKFDDIADDCFAPYRGTGVPLAAYFGAVTAYDDAVGKIIAALEHHDRRQDTLVIYTSLSGETFRYRDSVNHANSCHDDAIRVPVIVSWPGAVRGGRTLDALIGHHDLVPSLADFFEVDLPERQGRSVRPLIEDDGASDHWRSQIYISNQHRRHIRSSGDPSTPGFRVYPAWRQRAIWDGRHKFILSADDGCAFLFDQAIDPEEEFNIYHVPRRSSQALFEQFRDQRAKVIKLAQSLKTEAQQVDDRLGIELAEAAVSDPAFGALGPGEPMS